MRTTKETVKTLCRNIVSRLEHEKAIEFRPEDRQGVTDDVFSHIGPHIFTDQDLHEKTLEKIGATGEGLDETGFTESEQYRTARSIVRKEFGDDELNGLYYQKTIKALADEMCGLFMKSDRIEDVFETDDRLSQMIVDIVKHFNPAHLH